MILCRASDWNDRLWPRLLKSELAALADEFRYTLNMRHAGRDAGFQSGFAAQMHHLHS